MTVRRVMSERHQPSDEDLVAALVAGDHAALVELHARYAPLVFRLAGRAVDGAAAEDVVQDVLLTLWRQAASYDAARGPVRAWVIRMAQSRIANELRRRRRRPHGEPDPDGRVLASIADDGPGPADAAWRAYRRATLRAAFAELPPAQRRALGLAFFDDMTHEQVAALLEVPLGTAKTRIRAGIQRLRALLPAIAAVSLGIALVVGMREHARRLAFERDERALALVTASDSTNLRLGPVADVAPTTHARYRGRAGTPLAVLTLSNFAPAPDGHVYQGWASHAGTWASLGVLTPDATGAARVIIEDAALATPPDAVQITIEPAPTSATPTGPVVVRWPEP